MYRQSEKNLLSSNISSTCPHNMVNFGPLAASTCPRNMVNFGPLAAEIVLLVWGTPGNFNGFRLLAALLHGTLVVGVSQTASFNRGRHLYSAGRPSCWALAHISSCFLSSSDQDRSQYPTPLRRRTRWLVTLSWARAGKYTSHLLASHLKGSGMHFSHFYLFTDVLK